MICAWTSVLLWRTVPNFPCLTFGGHSIHAVVQNGPPPRSFRCRCARLHHGPGHCGPPNTRLRHECSYATSELPLDLVIPITTSVLPCSELSRCGLAAPDHEEIFKRRPTLTAPARDSVWMLRVGTKKWAFKSNKEI